MRLKSIHCLRLLIIATCCWFSFPVKAAGILPESHIFFSPGQVKSSSPGFNCYMDTIPQKHHTQPVFNKKLLSPRTAALRSTLLPGLGQLYNRKWWKIPLVYGALGATGGIFIYNLRWYNRIRYATNVLLTDGPGAYEKVHPILQNTVKNNNIDALRYRRNTFRKDIDYSALFFMLAWALNIVDATVDAHLNSFDVGPDLSFKIKPGYSDLAKTNGVSFVLHFK